MSRYYLSFVLLFSFFSVKAQLSFSDTDYKLTPTTNAKSERIQIEQPNPQLLSLKGSLKQIIAFLKSVNTSQVSVSDKDNTYYELLYKQTANKEVILDKVAQDLRLSIVESQKGGQTLQLTLKNYDKLTPIKQNRKYPSANLSVEEEQVMIQGLGLRDMLTVLSPLREIPIILHNKPQYVRVQPYDWRIPYYFDEALFKRLSEYGFRVEYKRDNYPTFTVIRMP